MQRSEYQKKLAISQSAIKCFKTKSLHEFRETYITQTRVDDDNDKFAFGSLTDTIAFTPKLLDERFYIPDTEVTIPSDSIKKIIDKTYRKAEEIVKTKKLLNSQGKLPEPIRVPDLTFMGEWFDLLYETAKELNYGGKTWSKTRILDNIQMDGDGYFYHLAQANGRYIITGIDNADAVDVVDALRASKDTSMYFTPLENEELLFQQEIFVDFIYENDLIVPLKAALDILRLNHERKTIQVADLKTTHSTEIFTRQVWDYDYVTQVSFYMFIVKEWLKTYQGGKYSAYQAELPVNIAIDRKYKIPYVYEYEWDDLNIAEHGSKEKSVTGWRSLLDDIAWHIKMSVWDRPRELFENGKIKLKIYR